jgi:hypothetical protein
MTTRHFQRAVSAVATAVGRPSLLASTRLPSFWAAVPAAAAEVPQVAAQSSDDFTFLSSFGVPTAVILATTAGLYAIGQQVYAIGLQAGEMKWQVGEKTIATITAATEAKIAANKEAAASAIASTEAKLAAAEKVIAAMMAGVPVAAELATLKALKGEPKRETPRDERKEH